MRLHNPHTWYTCVCNQEQKTKWRPRTLQEDTPPAVLLEDERREEAQQHLLCPTLGRKHTVGHERASLFVN
jgi:hypothetical protein